MRKVWDYVKSYTNKIVLNKDDSELESKLYKVYEKLHPKFQDVDLGVQMQIGEKLGSPKIPNVGDLAKKRKLVKIDDAEANQIIKRLKIKL